MDKSNIIVGFRTGRGGQFHNPGHVTFMPEVRSLQDLIDGEDTIITEDEHGNQLPDDKWLLIDNGDNVILKGREEIEAETGRLDYDGIYRSYDACHLADCSNEQLEAIYNGYVNEDFYVYRLDDRLNAIVDYVCEWKGQMHIRIMDIYSDFALIITGGGTSRFYYSDAKTDEEVLDKWERFCDDKCVDPVSRKYLTFEMSNHTFRTMTMKEQVLQAIESYEKDMSGEDVKYEITDTIELKDGASLYLFEQKDLGIRSSAIGYEDGTVFVMRDWQGSRPTTAEEIDDYPDEWIHTDGGYGIMLNGLPRIM